MQIPWENSACISVVSHKIKQILNQKVQPACMLNIASEVSQSQYLRVPVPEGPRVET